MQYMQYHMYGISNMWMLMFKDVPTGTRKLGQNLLKCDEAHL